jgi:hypothetical protein
MHVQESDHESADHGLGGTGEDPNLHVALCMTQMYPQDAFHEGFRFHS